MNKILFLPTGYEAPKTSNFYMRFQEGENKFRILSQPIIGWEDWLDKKPIRYRFEDKPAKPIDAKKPVKHFWAMIVWNYQEEEIQVLHLTQSTIRKGLEALCNDEDWGAPYFYDLKVMKTGEGIETEYSLNPLPHKPLQPHIKDLFEQRKCNLEALFYNDDPFSKEHVEFTPGIFTQEQHSPSALNHNMPHRLSMDQAYELDMILGECDEKYKAWFFGNIKKQFNADTIADLPLEIFDKVKQSAVNNMNLNHEKQRANEPMAVPF